jgi:hypothetical protein
MDWGKLFSLRWSSSARRTTEAAKMVRLEKRRWKRVPVALPVFVYGRTQGQPFAEQTETADISEHGGLVSLSVELARSQTLLVTNLQTNEDLACRVARIGRTAAGKTMVGLEFLRPSPHFWSVKFNS